MLLLPFCREPDGDVDDRFPLDFLSDEERLRDELFLVVEVVVDAASTGGTTLGGAMLPVDRAAPVTDVTAEELDEFRGNMFGTPVAPYEGSCMVYGEYPPLAAAPANCCCRN